MTIICLVIENFKGTFAVLTVEVSLGQNSLDSLMIGSLRLVLYKR